MMAANEKSTSLCFLIRLVSMVYAMTSTMAEQERNCSKSNVEFAHKKDLDGRLGVYPVLEFTSLTKLDCSIACQRLPFCNAFSVTSNTRKCYLYSHQNPLPGTSESGALTFASLEYRGLCPESFHYVHPNHCYYFSITRTSYQQASQRCRAKGGRLVTLDTQEKRTAFFDFFKRFHGFQVYNLWYWLGATYLQTQGTWVWETSGQAVQGEWLLRSQGSNYCMLYGCYNTCGYYAYPCYTQYPYICEYAQPVA